MRFEICHLQGGEPLKFSAWVTAFERRPSSPLHLAAFSTSRHGRPWSAQTEGDAKRGRGRNDTFYRAPRSPLPLVSPPTLAPRRSITMVMGAN